MRARVALRIVSHNFKMRDAHYFLAYKIAKKGIPISTTGKTQHKNALCVFRASLSAFLPALLQSSGKLTDPLGRSVREGGVGRSAIFGR